MARMIARSGARVDFIAMVRSSAPQISTQALRTHRVNPPFRPSSRDVGRQSGHCPPGPPNQHTTRWPLVFCMSWHADFGFRGAGLVVLWSGDARVISEQVSAGQFFSALRKGREKQVFLCLSLRFHETARFPLPAVRCCNTPCIALHRLASPCIAFHHLSPPFTAFRRLSPWFRSCDRSPHTRYNIATAAFCAARLAAMRALGGAAWAT